MTTPTWAAVVAQTLWPLRPARSCAVLVLAAAVAACSGDGAVPPEAAVDPAALCLSSTCGEVQPLLPVPDAENLHFTPDGRLFVSGGTGVFEVLATMDGFERQPIHAAECNFTGLAQRGQVLYATCFDGRLYAAELGATPLLAPIHDLGMSAPNGLVVGPDGALYITNGPLALELALPEPRIVRVVLDAGDPFSVVEQQDWLTSGLSFPNGLAVRDRELFITDSSLLPLVLGRVLRVTIGPDGQPGPLEELASFFSILDDLSVVGDHLLVTLFTEGSIALVAPDGTVVQKTDPLALAFPSAVLVGQPPLFSPDEILITEKGVLGEASSDFGNRLSVLRRID